VHHGGSGQWLRGQDWQLFINIDSAVVTVEIKLYTKQTVSRVAKITQDTLENSSH